MLPSFLNPWLWAGALMVGVPIWLHLRRRDEKELVRFSAVRFLLDQPLARRSPWRLRHWLLLLCRVLAVLALVGAFSWPFWKPKAQAEIRETRVYILDNTLSRQANRGFELDRSRLLQDLRTAGPRVRIGVIELTSTAHVVVEPGDTPESASEKLARLRPSWQRGSYLAAFRQASTLLKDTLGSRKRIVLLGDNQANQWHEGASSPPFLQGVEIVLPRSEVRERPNLSLGEPQVQRMLLGGRCRAFLTFKLHHQGPASSAHLVVRSNGKEVQAQTVDLTGQPETMTLQTEWEMEPGHWLYGDIQVEGSPDALKADNQVWFSMPPLEEGKVALLAQSAYLRLALSPQVMRGHWKTEFLEPSLLAGAGDNAGQEDVLCLESNYLQSGVVRSLLWRYLNSGRGVLLVVDRVTPAVQECLRELGYEVVQTVHFAEEHGARFEYVNSLDPLLRPFLSPDYGRLADVEVEQYVRLRAVQALPLIVSDHGDGLLFQSMRKTGRLYVLAFGLDRQHCSWPVEASFIPFVDLALQAARAQESEPNAFEPGQTALLHLPQVPANREVRLQRRGREYGRTVVSGAQALMRMPEEPGLYEVDEVGQERPVKLLCVNPPARESELVYDSKTDVPESWKFKEPATVQTPEPPRFSEGRGEAILQQRWWWWMLLAGLLCLWLESILEEVGKESA